MGRQWDGDNNFETECTCWWFYNYVFDITFKDQLVVKRHSLDKDCKHICGYV